MAGYLARKLGGYHIKALAEHFNRDPVVMSQGIMKVERKLMTDGAVQQTIITLEEVLTRNRKKKILL